MDNTTKGIGRDMTFLERVAMETGVNVVAGSGLSIVVHLLHLS